MGNDICEACGESKLLIKHHWYWIDNPNIPYAKTSKDAPRKIYIRGYILYYHEKMICLKCNRALIFNQLRCFKGSSIKPFKITDNSHILPSWDIQKAYIQYHKQLEIKYAIIQEEQNKLIKERIRLSDLSKKEADEYALKNQIMELTNAKLEISQQMGN